MESIPINWRMIPQRLKLTGVKYEKCGHVDLQNRPQCPHCLPTFIEQASTSPQAEGLFTAAVAVLATADST